MTNITVHALATIDVATGVNSLYMILCTSLLPLCILGIALFYSGLTQRRSALTMLALPILVGPFIYIDWFIWGYSLCYSKSSNRFIGNLDFAVLRHLRQSMTLIYITPRGDILSINHFLFNGLFKIICAALTFPGCVAERGRILPMLVFMFFWSCMIYNPVTYWFWNRNGWLSVELGKLPVLDFAGGNCIHIVSGFTALAYSYTLGPRNPKILYDYRNSNTSFIVIGTFLLLFGWVGFIGGCDYQFSTFSLFIFTNTILCASTSGIVWALIDYYFSSIPLEGDASLPSPQDGGKLVSYASRVSQTGVTINQHYHESQSVRRKISMISFCSGIMTGLVVITPAGGYISSSTEFWKSIVFGVVGAVIGNLSTRLKYFFDIDDALDIFAIHGIAGIVGSLLTGLFANQQYKSGGGWINHHWKQFGYQLLGCVVVSAYVFVLSCFFLYIIDIIPGFHLRIDKDFNRRSRLVRQDSEETQAALDQVEEPFLEKAELLGTDGFDFNGEYTMDFIEFIKVIRPQDYQETEEEQQEYHYGLGTDFEMHQEGNYLNKRE